MKTKKFRWGGVLLTLALVLSVILIPFSAFADTAEVPLMLTVEAAPLEFTVTESIQMSVIQGNSDLTITPVTVTNNGSEDLKVSQIEITAETGWSLTSSDTDFTTSDSKGKLAFTLNSHDFSGGAYTPGDELSAGGSKEYQLAGKISSQADLMAAGKVSDFVVTVEKAVSLITFYAPFPYTDYTQGVAVTPENGCECQAEEGMTWEEWVNSEYNTYNIAIYSETFGDNVVIGINGATRAYVLKNVMKTDLIIEKECYAFVMVSLYD